MSGKPPQRPSPAPRNWPGWLGAGLIWLTGKTPQPVALALSRPFGWLMARLMKGRRHVAQRNIQRCFPDFTEEQRASLLRQHFRAMARMPFEVAWSWSASDRFMRRVGALRGEEHLRAAVDEGNGVLLFTGHFTCLEIGGRLTGMAFPEARLVYRPLGNAVIEWYQNRGRARYSGGGFSKRELRRTIPFLRRGGVLWYAPDQDFGAEQSEFVPFFGISTATLATTSRLAELTGCAVVPMFPVYEERSRHYEVTFFPALENFPSGDLAADLTRVNTMLEQQIRLVPHQYWWIHRRFKTRPEGEPPFYD
ncbi:MAG: lipid A biosynthesis lauroyl acyltransferase [Lysobacterales bacterium]|jgi:KDO2-lipid IV(A) lauroyltransferase